MEITMKAITMKTKITTVDSSRFVQSQHCLTDMFMAQVKSTPLSPAVVFEHEVLNYQELARQSHQLAGYLAYLGAATDECIAVFTNPSLELMIGVWGVLFASSAYLPLSPEYPEERIKYMIEDSKTRFIFCQQALKSQLLALIGQQAAEQLTIVTIEDAQAFWASHVVNEQKPVTLLNQHHLAYVIYTSGSTGKPKGVMIEHQSVVNQMQWLQNQFDFGQHTRILQKTPMSFDAAQWEILGVCFGATVVMSTPGSYRDPEALVDIIMAQKVTSFQCVPTLLQAILDTVGIHDCHSLDKIFSGGEILTKPLAMQSFETLPNCQLINLYGPTECTINSSAQIVNPATVANGPNAIAIGKPVANTQYYIINEQGNIASGQETGELHIGGTQLARGYLHRPDMTAQKFITHQFADGTTTRLYRTGDLGYCLEDGTVQFCGRTDNQVKLRGFRVELDEIRLAIEEHDWVKNAAMLIQKDTRTEFQNLIACIELNQKEAALMDQGKHSAHHQSKSSKLQVKAQLSNSGCRNVSELNGEVLNLPGKEASAAQRALVFARKTYRFFDGEAVQQQDLSALLSGQASQVADTPCINDMTHLDIATVGELLRYFGRFVSTQRLLPKYGYASPGALYAVQIYLQLSGIAGLDSGLYYYHPIEHQLVKIQSTAATAKPSFNLHFLGRKSAIETVYQDNIQEVLEMECGHMLGLFDHVLPQYGLALGQGQFDPQIKPQLSCQNEDYYLGTFALVPASQAVSDDNIDLYVQVHPDKIADMNSGHYHYQHGGFAPVSDKLILKKHVIAINQQVYERASFGISMVCNDPRQWLHYVALGRKLQRLQMNDRRLGLMSSGYSSKSGHDLPSAIQMRNLLKHTDFKVESFYFCIGGRISPAQQTCEGMKEDSIHMKGPVEIIKDDLYQQLPNYMVPNKVLIVKSLPQTANGKVDNKALAELPEVTQQANDRPFIAPRNETEQQLAEIWKKTMKWDAVSVEDNFFESGGNSLMAVAMINKINAAFGVELPLQVLFETPTIESLAHKVSELELQPSSRLVPLVTDGSKSPIYCWPGLGGYPMNLRTLANEISLDRPFFGVQAHGINRAEVPYATIKEMALADIKALKREQSSGPYTLWGYSFGARVAFEVAHQLESAGDEVENLLLIAPGSPQLHGVIEATYGNHARFDNPGFVTILFSVFAHSIKGPALEECLRVTTCESSFVDYMCRRYKHLDHSLVRRITEIVRQTYEFKYTFKELNKREIKAPITIFKAQGDDYSFLENSSQFSVIPPRMIELETDHYNLLKTGGIDDLVAQIEKITNQPTQPSARLAAELSRDLDFQLDFSADLSHEFNPGFRGGNIPPAELMA